MPLKPISTVPSDFTKTGVILSPPDRFSISFQYSGNLETSISSKSCPCSSSYSRIKSQYPHVG